MAEDLRDSQPGGSNVDAAASDACTRSGTFALLLATALLLLNPYWIRHPREIALGRYMVLRLDLAIQSDALEDEPLWKRYRATHPSAESASIASLVNATIDATPKPLPDEKGAQSAIRPNSGRVVLGAKHEEQTPSPAPDLPPAPSDFRVSIAARVATLSNIVGIRDDLIKLNDARLLTESRKSWTFFDASITRWTQKRRDVIYENVVESRCSPAGIEAPGEVAGTPYFVPTYTNGALLDCLSISEIRDLAHFELPTIYDPTRLEGRLQGEVQIAPGALPRDLLAASIVTQMLLFVSIMYFGAYLRESILSLRFPSPGTLFGAFSRSRWTRLVLALAYAIPVVASVSVAITSFRWELALCSVVITGAVVFACAPLASRAYFRSGILDSRRTGSTVVSDRVAGM